MHRRASRDPNGGLPAASSGSPLFDEAKEGDLVSGIEMKQAEDEDEVDVESVKVVAREELAATKRFLQQCAAPILRPAMHRRFIDPSIEFVQC